jgi:hypothetical protein
MVKEFVGPVYLEPIEHVYIHKETGKRYGSVTQMLGSIEHEFETELVAERISKQSDKNPKKNPDYVGLSYEEIIDYWQMLNDTANEYGTFVHEAVEKYLLANKWYFPKKDTEDGLLESKVIKAYKKLEVDEGVCMYPERIMFSEKYSLAGTADLKIDIDDKFFDIGDWKTNKKFEYFNPFGSQCLKKPLDHLQQCHHNVYSLQLSVYALMCEEETGMKCRQIWIGYWSRETEEFTRIPITYLKNEATTLLKLHKYNKEIAA